ncbi:ParB/RepB/Spo0J family partition protein [Extibacter muris]|uniref:ParB/RepB/Spo0J family partition protein n=1 Tax=Extibacter muris TaxID=1796622 RepID=A0A4R4FFM3_9FIRM|nr:ParB/RepB/Spo0J family partition protein [Extibacter muris]MCU0078458.1 ParB/RepB/Spo0J family partition protein [Extibacter muris]TDA21583.1 ParB/RepB/Spo0J family partition protein [Extibacter muris]
MAKGRGINLNLPSADDLFSTQEERDEVKREMVMEIGIEEISDFPDHPFKVRMDEEMQNLVESVRQYGVLSPALVRTKPEGGYEMVAGHRRKYASEIAEKKDIPCIVRELSDEEATILMVDSNLQRETILPSEKAFAYKMKLDAMKRQGKRTDLTSEPVAWKLKGRESAEILGEQVGESKDQVRRYIRLTNLIPELLELVDNSVLKEKGMLQIAMRPAVELSYLPKEEQTALYETIESEDCTPSHAQAIKMRQFSEQGRLNEDVIFSILSEEKGNQKEQFRMPKERISKFFPPGTSVKQVEDTIIKALEMYRKRERSRER